MTDDQGQPDHFTDSSGNLYALDPTGQARYRKWEGTEWGDYITDGPGHPTRFSAYSAPSEPELDEDEDDEDYVDDRALPRVTERRPISDGPASFLEFVGWVAVIGSVIAGVALQADSTSYYSSTPSGLGWAVGIAGVIQGLLLVGFGRVVRYMAETAEHTRRSAELLAVAVRDARG